MIASAQSTVTKIFCFLAYFETKLFLTTFNYVFKMFGHVKIISKKYFGNKWLFYKLKLVIPTYK